MDMIAEAKVVCSVHYGISYWEIKLTYASGRNKIIDFPLSTAKELQITKSLNGTKKLGIWFNSKVGLEYLNKHYI